MEINRNFQWDSPYFNNMNESTLKFSKRLLDEGFIKDVYLKNTNGKDLVYIIHTITEGCNFQKEFINKSKGIDGSPREFVLPLNFKASNSAGCAEKANYDCKFFGCPIIIAGYLYHNERNLKNDVVKKLCSLKDEVKIINELSNEELLKQFMTDDFKIKHDESLSVIDREVTIPKAIKEHFYKVLKILDSYTKIIEKYPQKRPNLNLALIDNTDTNNKICIGQSNCINVYSKILSIEKMIDISEGLFEDNLKYVDFKNITEKDTFIEDNYKAPIIVLHNIFYMTANISNGGSSEQVMNESIVRGGFPEFIIRNSHKKIFILCDKESNIKLLYDKIPQLKLVFETLKIPDLKVDEVYKLAMLKFKDNSRGISYNDSFEMDFKEYLSTNYIYSPYKNLEFIEFIYNDAIKKTLLTNHPNEVHIENLQVFRLLKNAGASNLKELIGLDNVKNEIKNLETFLRFSKEKEKMGDKMPKIDLHMCFLGNPGTGKTTVARFMADILFNLEYIRYNKCIECEAKDLIANVPGQTAMKTSEKIQEALGGILFVDEAYAITESEYGKECVAALIKSMEDYRDDLVVILAGYSKEMSQFLELNSGFKSRIAFYFKFEDYSNEELYQMFERLVSQYGFEIKDLQVRNKVFNILDQEKKLGSGFGNSRYIRNLVDIALRQHAINCAQEKNNNIRYHILLPEDIRRKQSAT